MSVSSVRFLLSLTIAFGLVAFPTADTTDATIAQEAQALLEHLAPADGPGVAMLIAKGDTVIFRSARGRAEIELGVPLSPDHVFRIASVTKTFTASLVLKLVEEGKLSLDDRLAKFLPDFPNGSDITIRQLLSHTAGISDRGTGSQTGSSRRDIDRDTRLAEIRKRPLDFAPGTDWRYSNTGYILLGMVIEQVTGEPWHVAMQKRILTPLGLTHTQYGDLDKLMPGRVHGYTTDTPDHAVQNAEYIRPSVPDAAGALVSTLDDLFHFARAMAAGRVVSRGTLHQMITPAPASTSAGGYGFGVFLWRVRGTMMVGHTGQIPGFASVLGYVPDKDLTVIALGNDDNFDARTTGRRLAAIAMGQPYVPAVGVPTSETELQPLTGTYRINDTLSRTVFVKDHVLYTQRSGRNAFPMQVTANGELHFIGDELSYFVPVRDNGGRVTRLDYFADGEGPPQPLTRIENASH
jgi:CubicO group peptidase (beta-lactamase class C family)